MDRNTQENNPPKKFRDYRGLFCLIVACLAVLAVIIYFYQIKSVIDHYMGFLASVLYGVFIAFLLNPIVNYFQPRITQKYLSSKKESRRTNAAVKAKRWSIAIAITIGVLFVILLCLLIIPELLTSIIKLGENTPSMIKSVTATIDKWTSKRNIPENFQKPIDEILEHLGQWVTDTLLPNATSAFTAITTAAWNFIKFIVNFLVGFVIAIYALNEKNFFISWSKKLTFAVFKPNTANFVLDTARHGNIVFGKYLLGSIIDSLVVALICFIFNCIAGIPYPLLISALVGITNIIPFFGPFLGAIPSALLILVNDPIKALVFVIFIIIFQQIEGNIIAPKVLGNVTGISEFWVTFALLFFGAMFGLFGMVVGVPLLAVISYVFKRVANRHIADKGYTENTDFYLEVDRYDTESGSFSMIDHKKEREKQILKAKPRNEKMAAFYGKVFEKLKKPLRRKKDGSK